MNYLKNIGKYGEKLACDYLVRKGYEILELNKKISFQEIDIIAKKNNNYIFIEVKTRTNNIYGRADEAFNSRKINGIKKAIQGFIFENNLDEDIFQIDLIAVDINRFKKIANIKHYKNIF